MLAAAGSSIPAITHSVIFNCTGAYKEKCYQEVLAKPGKYSSIKSLLFNIAQLL